MSTTPSQLQTIGPEELAEALGVSEWTVWRMRKDGQLPPCLHIRSKIRWRVADIEAWMVSNMEDAASVHPAHAARAARSVEARFGARQAESEPPPRRRRRGRPTKAEQVGRRR